MNTYKNFSEAEAAANNFFAENFGYTGGVSIEKRVKIENGEQVEFYSKDDPAMDDTFTCIIEDKKYIVEVEKALDWNGGFLDWNGNVVDNIKDAKEFETEEAAEDEAAHFNMEYGRNGRIYARVR